MAKRSGEYWTHSEECQLATMWRHGMSKQEIAKEFERSVGGIESRLDKLGFVSQYDRIRNPCSETPMPSKTCIKVAQEEFKNYTNKGLKSFTDAFLTNEKQEKLMNRMVTTKTFIGDTEAEIYSGEELLAIIEREQEFYDRLQRLTQTKGIATMLARHEDNINKLIEILGGRND